jgi:hypothetical protein
MTAGVVLIARNNGAVDYIEQAIYLASRVSKYLNLPTTLLTDDVDLVHSRYDSNFDNVIALPESVPHSHRAYYDGTYTRKILEFKNTDRVRAYDLSPYTETLLLDTDYIIANDSLKHCFNQNHNFLIYKDGIDLAGWRSNDEFKRINQTGPEFYWATCVFFRQSETNKIFFDLLQHIVENWLHYRTIYNIGSSVFRNDYVFSIGIHIMNGYTKNDFARKMPGKMFYMLDRDICLDITDDEFLILTERPDNSKEYNPHKVKGSSVHVMNKFSLSRIINA